MVSPSQSKVGKTVLTLGTELGELELGCLGSSLFTLTAVWHGKSLNLCLVPNGDGGTPTLKSHHEKLRDTL